MDFAKASNDMDVLEAAPDEHITEHLDQQLALDRLMKLIDALRAQDRQVILLYLEGLDTASIGTTSEFVMFE
jgi:DNA-directed RNA polymerase specialized sigma24 family protein